MTGETSDPTPLVEHDGDEFMASTDDPPVYGVGETREAAIADYQVALDQWRAKNQERDPG